MEKVRAYFELRSKGSTIQTELLAGLSTFLVLSYIFIVNPAILAEAGMDRGAVFLATVLVSGLSTIAMGLWARLPFVLAPGMEMNSYVAFFVVGSMGLTWQQALGAVFWSGVLFVILSVARVRQQIIDAIPERMKASLSLSVGVFLALVGGRIAGLLRFEGVRLVGFGEWLTPEALAFYAGLAVVLLLDRLRVRSAMLLSIAASALVCWTLGLGQQPTPVSWHTLAGLGAMDLGVIIHPASWSAILVLFLVDFYGSVAKLIGLAEDTTILENGRVPRMRRALLVDSLGTTAAAALGTTNVTVYVESAVGIRAGGRSGLSAVCCGLLMLASLPLAPLLAHIPLAATSGALIFVAIHLFPSTTQLRTFSSRDVVSAIAMQLAVVATFALDVAILAGLSVDTLAKLANRETPSPYSVISIVLLVVGMLIGR